jgi:disulfide bond formation protein DsbB
MTLYLIWVVSMLASVSSLYFIEVQHWAIGNLGWYQLVCMLPIAIISGIAAWDGFKGIARYLFPQSLIGLGLSIYEFILECYLPSSPKTIHICNPEKTILTFNIHFNLALFFAVSFLLINLFLITIWWQKRKIA